MAHAVVTEYREQLHRHFAWSEFASDGRNVPAAARSGLYELVETLLVPLRGEFGPCRVTSGYRTQAHNRRVGGKPDSRHLYDKHPGSPAADVRFATGSPQLWSIHAQRLMPTYGGIGVYRTHVHLDCRNSRARWSG